MLLNDLQGKKIGICASGGLDSKTVASVLVREGLDVTCFSADLGQPDEKDVSDIRERMATCGTDTIIVDLKDQMAEACFLAIRAQAKYDGGYWNTTGLGRAVTVKGLVQAMLNEERNVLVHGATGRGNDQVRFERYTNELAPNMQVYAPWRDLELLKKFPGRKEMAAYLRDIGVEAEVGPKKRYSTDANLGGLSHEAEDLEELQTPCTIVEPIMGVWPAEAPDQVEQVTIEFEQGFCTALNGSQLTPLQAMQEANKLAGRNGIWMKNALENRIVGTKSRGVYEAPGMELLGTALSYLYQTILNRQATQLLANLSGLIAQQIYDGRYYEPATCAAFAAVKSLAEPATGEVTLGLYKGNLYFLALNNCRASIYNEADSSMEASSGLNPASAQGFVEIQSVEALALARAGLISQPK